jgi:quinol monooxygenase YgiN
MMHNFISFRPGLQQNDAVPCEKVCRRPAFFFKKRRQCAILLLSWRKKGGDSPVLVFNVTFKCKPGMRDEFLEKIRTEGIDAASRAEEGNLMYAYYLPLDGSDDLLLIEKYRDADAVAAHVRQAHVARLVELKTEYVSDLILEKYETEQ